jgi:hypothetical protein
MATSNSDKSVKCMRSKTSEVRAFICPISLLRICWVPGTLQKHKEESRKRAGRYSRISEFPGDTQRTVKRM